jgi:hypothetical protein
MAKKTDLARVWVYPQKDVNECIVFGPLAGNTANQLYKNLVKSNHSCGIGSEDIYQSNKRVNPTWKFIEVGNKRCD